MGQMVVLLPYMEHMGMGDIAFFFANYQNHWEQSLLRVVRIMFGSHFGQTYSIMISGTGSSLQEVSHSWGRKVIESIRTMPASKKKCCNAPACNHVVLTRLCSPVNISELIDGKPISLIICSPKDKICLLHIHRHTADGRNPAPVGKWVFPLFTVFHRYLS